MKVEIDLGAIRRNLRRIAAKTSKPLALMVKADGYGHGALQVARAVEANWYGVATEEEGIPLRELEKQVLVTAPSCFGAPLLARYDMIPLIGEWELAKAAIACGVKRCHLAVNSGMNRLGFTGEKECYEAAALLTEGGVRVEGIATHYKGSDGEILRAQNEAFDRAVIAARKGAADKGAQGRTFTHVTGSGALYASGYDVLRVGLAAYGYHGEYTAGIPLEKAMRVTSRVIKKKRIVRGDTLGYAGAFRATRSLYAYTVLGGYGDGVARVDAGRKVIAAGRRLKVAAVSMDSFEMISDRVDLPVGTRVIILSDAVDAEMVAAHRGTIPYEVLLGFNVPRAEKVYVDERTGEKDGQGAFVRFDPRGKG